MARAEKGIFQWENYRVSPEPGESKCALVSSLGEVLATGVAATRRQAICWSGKIIAQATFVETQEDTWK